MRCTFCFINPHENIILGYENKDQSSNSECVFFAFQLALIPSEKTWICHIELHILGKPTHVIFPQVENWATHSKIKSWFIWLLSIFNRVLYVMLSLKEMKLVIWIQILVKVFCISLQANALGKGMNPFVFPPPMGN